MINEEHKCNICIKTYSCYRSLWTHNKKYHKGIKDEKTVNINEYKCRTCDKKYKHKQTRCTHEKTCIGKKTIDREIELEKMKQETLDKEQKTLELKIKLQSMKRVDNKTFKAINKVLIDKSITNNTQNITNNYQIFSIGNEDVVNTLSINDKQLIINRKWCSIDEIVKMVHCEGPNMFKNILITNLKDKFAYTFDESKGYFITTTKTFILDDLISNRMMDIEAIYAELTTANLVDEKTKKMIQAFLDRMEEDDKPYMDEVEDVEHANYKAYKMNLIKVLLYNNQEKITRGISLLMN
jgi:hypothetical protein